MSEQYLQTILERHQRDIDELKQAVVEITLSTKYMTNIGADIKDELSSLRKAMDVSKPKDYYDILKRWVFIGSLAGTGLVGANWVYDSVKYLDNQISTTKRELIPAEQLLQMQRDVERLKK